MRKSSHIGIKILKLSIVSQGQKDHPTTSNTVNTTSYRQ